jgi:hypothetical protein
MNARGRESGPHTHEPNVGKPRPLRPPTIRHRHHFPTVANPTRAAPTWPNCHDAAPDGPTAVKRGPRPRHRHHIKVAQPAYYQKMQPGHTGAAIATLVDGTRRPPTRSHRHWRTNLPFGIRCWMAAQRPGVQRRAACRCLKNSP